MNIARIKYDQQIYYAAIDTEKDCAMLIDGDIFGREIVLTNTSLPLDDCTLLAPVKPPHVYAIGLNYAAHVDEFKHIDPTRANPDDPIAFLCATTAITGPNSPIVISRLDHTVDYEGELVAVIGRRCSRVSEEEALDYVLGYTCGNDVSDRTYQNADKQWLRAKSQPTYKPLGPWIVTDIKDPQNLAVRSYLNGELRQNGNSQLMIFSIALDRASFGVHHAGARRSDLQRHAGRRRPSRAWRHDHGRDRRHRHADEHSRRWRIMYK